MASRSISRSRFSVRPLRAISANPSISRAPGTSSMLRNSGLRYRRRRGKVGARLLRQEGRRGGERTDQREARASLFPPLPQPAQRGEIADAPAAARPRGIQLNRPPPPPQVRREVALERSDDQPARRAALALDLVIAVRKVRRQPSIDEPRGAVLQPQFGRANRRPLSVAHDDDVGAARRRRRAWQPRSSRSSTPVGDGDVRARRHSDAGCRCAPRQSTRRRRIVDQARTVRPPAAQTSRPIRSSDNSSDDSCVLRTSVHRLPHFSSGSLNVSGSWCALNIT